MPNVIALVRLSAITAQGFSGIPEYERFVGIDYESREKYQEILEEKKRKFAIDFGVDFKLIQATPIKGFVV